MCKDSQCNACCPDAKIFKEELCGNFQDINDVVWSAPTPNDYVQGTFEVFNAGPGPVLFTVNGGAVVTVPAGSSISRSVNNPTTFIVQSTGFGGAVPGTHGKWCIKLYKRLYA